MAAYDFSKQHAQGTPNFPGEPVGDGREDLSFATDLQHDPADTDDNFDPKTGWVEGIHIGGQNA